MNQEDKQLIAKAKKSKRDYEALYLKYAERIYNYFWYRLSHHHQLAEDLMQETFLKAFLALDKFQDQGYSYLTYLTTVAHNLLINYYRSPKPLPLNPSFDVPVENADLNTKLDAEVIWRAVAHLGEAKKDALFMHYRENLSIREIAEAMQKSENAVKLLLSRSRKKLKDNEFLEGIRAFADKKREPAPAKFLVKIK